MKSRTDHYKRKSGLVTLKNLIPILAFQGKYALKLYLHEANVMIGNRSSLLLLPILLLFCYCATMQHRWENAVSENSTSAYEKYIQNFPGSTFTDLARARLDSLYWQEAITEQTIDAYQNYIAKCTTCRFQDEAGEKIENLHYEKAKQVNERKFWDETLKMFIGYDIYLEKYPNGKFTDDAKRRIEERNFSKAVEKRNINLCLEYLMLHPDGKYTGEIQLLIKTIIDNIKKVRIIMEGRNEFDKYQGKPLDIETAVKAFFNYVGIEVVADKSTDYDAILYLDAGISALFTAFSGPPSLSPIKSCDLGLRPVLSFRRRDNSTSSEKRIDEIFRAGNNHPISAYGVSAFDWVPVAQSRYRERLYKNMPLPEKRLYLELLDFLYRNFFEKLWGIKPLLTALRNDSSGTQCKAAAALGKMIDPRAIGILDSLRKVPDNEAHLCAERAIQSMKEDPNTIDILISLLLKDQNFKILTETVQDTLFFTNSNYSKALQIIAAEDFHYYLVMLQQWKKTRQTNSENELTILNNSGQQVYAKIKDLKTKKFVDQIILQKDDQFTFYLPSGQFAEYLRYGSKPDAYYFCKGEGFELGSQTDNRNSVKLTLQAIMAGNYSTMECTQEEFEK